MMGDLSVIKRISTLDVLIFSGIVLAGYGNCLLYKFGGGTSLCVVEHADKMNIAKNMKAIFSGFRVVVTNVFWLLQNIKTSHHN
jgi:hypothetical protein